MASTDQFTDRERQLMAFAWQCFEGEPKADYKKLAGLAGMGNPTSASNAWAKIKKKIQSQAEAGGSTNGSGVGDGEDGTPNATPKPTPKKRGKGKGDVDDGESPTKKAKGGKGKAGKKGLGCVAEGDGVSPVKAEPEEEDDEVFK